MFKPKFYAKCKSSLTTTKTRIEVLKKKKGSVVKYLKSVIAELLSTGLDYNAYCRVEGLMIEQDRLSCYHLIDQFVECVSNNLSSMKKQSTCGNRMLTKVIGEVLRNYRQQTLETCRECPEECREAVASLIYATARFSEFPELRDLRTMFTEKYGNSLEQFTSKEFVEKLSSKAATKEMKLQLLHDIAQEFSVDWDAKSLEQKLFKPPSPKQESSYDSYRQKKSRDDIFQEDMTIDKAVDNRARKDVKNGGQNQQSISSDDEEVSVGGRYFTDPDSQVTSSTSVESCSEDEVNSKRPFFSRFIPPPYFKQKEKREESSKDDSVQAEKPKPKPKPKPRSVLRRRNLKPPPGGENIGSEPSEGKPYLKPTPSHYNSENAEGSTRQKKTMLAVPPERAASMPAEPTTPYESSKSHARQNSLQNETLAGHVHPKLPDYDNLAAQIAVLKGR